ncbi:DgyrCDS12143 [Dimorphilus gyrociliatus]|uniref:DgyrCDS12143 n=1 Tax=Dimorphilus gyrociliatus TaxID=2664684 RepID=A0A7I8W6M5_9ANNE|nr:DgyrCDS12143 [Dimorphilus gyrociliatus]
MLGANVLGGTMESSKKIRKLPELTSDLRVGERKYRKVIKPTAIYRKRVNSPPSPGPNGPSEISVSETTAFQQPSKTRPRRTRYIDVQDLEALEKFHLDDSFSLASVNSTNELNLGNSQSDWFGHHRIQTDNSRGKRRSRD